MEIRSILSKNPQLQWLRDARGTLILPQALADDQLSLTVDQANYFAFKVNIFGLEYKLGELLGTPTNQNFIDKIAKM